MTFSNNHISIDTAKAIDLVAYLASLGFEPARIRGGDYWYLSPLRQETEPSFKINRSRNVWYDHGMGKGGTLIDFAILYHNCTIGELLRSLSAAPLLSFQQRDFTAPAPVQQTNTTIEVLDTFLLSSVALLRYLKQRQIPLSIAEQYCVEIRFSLNGKTYYAIGFKNDLNGYEIRSPFFKLSASPKGVTTIRNGAQSIAVFEGFFDFLSFLSLIPVTAHNQYDFLVLNSLSFFENTIPFLEQHDHIHLYLDNDTAGQNCSRYACSLQHKYHDESGLYKNYKDLNDYRCGIARTPDSS